VSASASVLREYRRKHFKEFDSLFAGLLALFAAIEITVVIVGNQYELPEMTAEEVKEFLARRFVRAEEIAPPVDEPAPEGLTTPGDLAEEGAGEEAPEVVLEQPVERQRGAAEMRADRRARAETKRANRRAQISQDIINATGGIALVTGSGGSAAGGLVDAASVTAGTAISTEGLAGMVTGGAAENVRRLRTDAPAGGGSGGVDLQGVLGNVDASMVGETTGGLFQATAEAVDRSGKFSHEAARSAQALQAAVARYRPGIEDCFNKQLRRTSSLSGSVEPAFKIQADGSVTDVKIRRSSWNDEGAGRRVESCMKRKIADWRFDPIDESMGSMPVRYTFTF